MAAQRHSVATIDQLVDRLPSSRCDIDVLAALLLRFCRDHAEALRAGYDSHEAVVARGQAAERMREWFAVVDDHWLTAGELNELEALLRHSHDAIAACVTPEVAAAAAARAAAEGIDDALGRRFMGIFRRRGQTQLLSGEPFPVACPDWKTIYQHELGTNPQSRGRQLHELSRLRILPTIERGHQIHLDFVSADLLAELDGNAKIGIAIPCTGLSALKWRRSSSAGRPTFFGVCPRDQKAHWQAIQALLERAAAQDVRILIFPELTFSPSQAADVDKWLRHNDHKLSIIVCGSAHVKRGGHQRNASTILVVGDKPREHYKFNAFEYEEQKDGTTTRYLEDIATTPAAITAYMCTNWSFTTLICKDFLEDPVSELVEQLRVRLVLLPSCSAKTGPFEAPIAKLASGAQAVVVFANLVDDGQAAASGIIGRPRRRDVLQVISRADLAPPELRIVTVVDN